jgi:hypothetical protein
MQRAYARSRAEVSFDAEPAPAGPSAPPHPPTRSASPTNAAIHLIERDISSLLLFVGVIAAVLRRDP